MSNPSAGVNKFMCGLAHSQVVRKLEGINSLEKKEAWLMHKIFSYNLFTWRGPMTSPEIRFKRNTNTVESSPLTSYPTSGRLSDATTVTFVRHQCVFPKIEI